MDPEDFFLLVLAFFTADGQMAGFVSWPKLTLNGDERQESSHNPGYPTQWQIVLIETIEKLSGKFLQINRTLKLG